METVYALDQALNFCVLCGLFFMARYYFLVFQFINIQERIYFS